LLNLGFFRGWLVNILGSGCWFWRTLALLVFVWKEE
jgi:hypothetical protein